jgi:hypothetical protein
MVEEFRFGQMEAGMTASGETEWPTAMEGLFMLKEMSTRESGPMTKLMVLAFTPISTEAGTRGSGISTNSMDLESSNGQMVPSTRVTTNRE